MTVNFVYLTSNGTVHATDALITKASPGTNREKSPLSGKPKYLKIPALNGAMSWFGTVDFAGWNALEFLGTKEKEASTLEQGQVQVFCDKLALEIGEKLNGGGIKRLRPLGCGIHFTFYEKVDGIEEPVPEMIFITNYSGYDLSGGYSAQKITLSALRQTYHTITGNTNVEYAKHSELKYRNAVHQFLKHKKFIAYNNGDTFLCELGFKHVEALPGIFIARRKLHHMTPLELYSRKALFIVQTACLAHNLFNTEPLVAEPCFALSITPNGTYTESTSSTTTA